MFAPDRKLRRRIERLEVFEDHQHQRDQPLSAQELTRLLRYLRLL